MGRAIAEPLAAGLDLFAAAWLDQWAAIGGHVDVTGDGVKVGYPTYHYSPVYADDQRREHVLASDYGRAWSVGNFDGRIKALLDVLDNMPMGETAVAHHMISHGIARYSHARIPEPA